MRARTIRQSRLNPAQQSSWSSNTSRPVKRAVIEFWSVSYSQMILLGRLSVLFLRFVSCPYPADANRRCRPQTCQASAVQENILQNAARTVPGASPNSTGYFLGMSRTTQCGPAAARSKVPFGELAKRVRNGAGDSQCDRSVSNRFPSEAIADGVHS